MHFVPLHIYSGYSFLKSGLTIERIFDSAKANQYPAIGLSDLDGLFGYGGFFSEAKKAKIKGLPGLDLVFEGILLTFFALDEIGYRSLIKLSYARTAGRRSLNGEGRNRSSSDVQYARTSMRHIP
ncbi:MAG: PHP domain-containing protein, partial [Methanomicrobia archaeon]|nr:PHP domain-containing protein [Methanomicrobia archaeon]